MSEKVLNEESSDIDKILPYIKNLKKNADSLVKQNQSLENSLAKLQASNLFLKKELDSKTKQLKVYQELVNGYKKSTLLLNKIVLEYQSISNIENEEGDSENSQDLIFLRKKLQETINYYEERLDQQEKSISELFDKKVTNLDEEVNNLKRSIDEKDQKVKKLTELEQKLKSYESEKVQLTKNLSLLEYDYEQIKNKLIEIETEKNKNEETLSEFKNKENDTLILKELYNKLQIDSKKIENEYNKSINDLELSEKERILLQEKIDLISKDFEELKELKTIAERKFIQELDTSLKDSEKKHTKELKEKITTIKENETKITNFLKEITQLKENEIILKSELAKAKRLDLINLETLNNYIDFISERVYDVRRVLFHKIFHYIIDFKIKNEYNILTTKMIADTLGISLPTLYAELKELELKNIISFEKSEEIKSYYDYPINIGLQNRKSE